MKHTEEADAYLNLARKFQHLRNSIATVAARSACEAGRDHAIVMAAQSLGAVVASDEAKASGAELRECRMQMIVGLSQAVAAMQDVSATGSAYVPSFFADGKAPGVSTDEPAPDDATGWRWFRAGRERALGEVQDWLTASLPVVPDDAGEGKA